MTTHYRSCSLCDANCGLEITSDSGRVTSIRGDDRDPFSRGYMCPKGAALADLHADPDRLRAPRVREGSAWREVTWDIALDRVASELAATRARFGNDAIGVYQGNPTAHDFGLLTIGQVFFRSLATRNQFSATSLDSLPHMLAALLMFGDELLMPVPDLDRTDLFICLGANPVVSNGSLMTAPDMRGRLKALRERGGRMIVIDPRRTETAERADRHIFIRPGSDAALLMAIAHVLFAENLVRTGRLGTKGIAALRVAARAWPPERATTVTGIQAAEIRELARTFAGTPRAALYGRVGICTQALGGLATWLCWAVNVLAGHLDEPGGMMFTTPAVDPIGLAPILGVRGSFDRYRSRVSDKPEFCGQLPASVLAEEIETPGPGQIRALITSAGNPVLSIPGGPRLERALGGLDFMVAIDPYLNETTRFAHVILPPTSPLERSHYAIAMNAYAVRNVAKLSPPVFERPRDARHDWEICLALWTRLGPPRRLGRAARWIERVVAKLGPEAVLELALRLGPHAVSLARLRAMPHGIDLGPLERRLPGRLRTSDKQIDLAPAAYLRDLDRLDRLAAADGLVLIGRRHLRSNNSWMHNSARLVKGPERCTLLIHPDDAASRSLGDGELADVSAGGSSIAVPVEITDAVMPGVVSLPHGWGHGRPAIGLRIAAAHPGQSVNDILDPAASDELSGTSALSGQRVQVTRAAKSPR